MLDSYDPGQLTRAGQGLIVSVADLIHHIQTDRQGQRTLFRGQNVNKPLLPRFARRAKETNLQDPLEIEVQLLEAFKRQSIPYLTPPYPDTDWDWLALAQHHGLSTRLLDWTENPLVGLWFAVEPSSRESEGGVLWILRPESQDLKAPGRKTSLFNLKRTYVFQPYHITRRIVAQSGWFSIHKYLENTGDFLPLEKNKNFAKKLERYDIPQSS